MSTYGNFRDGGKTSEIGISRALSSNYYAEDGIVKAGHLKVSEKSGGANASVDIAAGDVIFFEGSTHARPGFSDATANVAVTANSSGNPRIDSAVAYWDESVVDDTNSDNPDVILFSVVAGTAAASPVAPTDAEIQSAVGAGNPFLRLADIDVADGFTSINDEQIEDRRTVAQSQEFVTRDYATNPERVISGLLFAVPGSGLTATMSTGSAYVRGYYMLKENDASEAYDYTFTASKDTYVDISYSPSNGEIFTFTEQTLGGAEPAVASNSIRLCKVVTDATDVTSVTDLRNYYARGYVTASAALNLTTAYQTVVGSSITFAVSQASVMKVTHWTHFSPSSGTAPTNTGDSLRVRMDLDSGTSRAMSVMQATADDSSVTISGTGHFTLSSGAHTTLLEATNTTGNRGAVVVSTGGVDLTGYTYEIWPGIAPSV